jgi:hypothetical protein
VSCTVSTAGRTGGLLPFACLHGVYHGVPFCVCLRGGTHSTAAPMTAHAHFGPATIGAMRARPSAWRRRGQGIWAAASASKRGDPFDRKRAHAKDGSLRRVSPVKIQCDVQLIIITCGGLGVPAGGSSLPLRGPDGHLTEDMCGGPVSN